MPGSEEELLGRLAARDATLWPEGNIAAERLGWLDSPRQIDRERKDLRSWAGTIDQETVVLLGQGGGASAAEMFSSVGRAFGDALERTLVVCDTTEPSAVEALPLEEAFIVVSSKSGTSREIDALYAYARSRQRDPARYAVITDPGTPLATLARSERVNRVFESRPDIGDAYSALSYPGAVPAVLLGYDLEELAGRAMEIDRLSAVADGIAMADAALEERTVLTLECDGSTRTVGDWIANLVAASTGKGGFGIVPVPTGAPEPGAERQSLTVTLERAHFVGATIFEHEIRTAIAAHRLGVDPFSLPDVADLETATASILGDLPIPPADTKGPDALWSFLDDEVAPGDYVTVESYLPGVAPEVLDALRSRIRDRNSGIAVTAGAGQQILHSTAQLHLGGPSTAIAIQLLPFSPRSALAIPGAPYDFGDLIDARAAASARSLARRGRRLLRVALDDLEELL